MDVVKAVGTSSVAAVRAVLAVALVAGGKGGWMEGWSERRKKIKRVREIQNKEICRVNGMGGSTIKTKTISTSAPERKEGRFEGRQKGRKE